MTFPDPDELEYMAKHPFVAIEDPNAMDGDSCPYCGKHSDNDAFESPEYIGRMGGIFDTFYDCYRVRCGKCGRYHDLAIEKELREFRRFTFPDFYLPKQKGFAFFDMKPTKTESKPTTEQRTLKLGLSRTVGKLLIPKPKESQVKNGRRRRVK